MTPSQRAKVVRVLDRIASRQEQDHDPERIRELRRDVRRLALCVLLSLPNPDRPELEM